MKTLREVLKDAEDRRIAVGHFNVSDLVLLRGVFSSARELNVPVLVGVSEGEREFMGVRQIVALVKSLREEHDYPIFLNADHTHSLAKADEAARAGFDAVVFDASSLPFDENVSQTRRTVIALKAINPSVIVEGEIGDIGSGSEIHEKVPERSKTLSTPEEARQFIAATGVDVLAPAVGNMHGLLESMVHGGVKKRLDIGRIDEIKKATGIFMTLHGASGTDDEDLKKAIQVGMTIVHINTELRVAWRHGMETAFAKDPQEIVPYKILPAALEAVKKIVRERLQLFNSTESPERGQQSARA
ncbi:MAG: class II fructose-bisphosphate aldolase [Acidobacteriia bacterium]|nr:class II fructose-bisphosphate aldolase [Terriglobia bacterium]